MEATRAAETDCWDGNKRGNVRTRVICKRSEHRSSTTSSLSSPSWEVTRVVKMVSWFYQYLIKFIFKKKKHIILL